MEVFPISTCGASRGVFVVSASWEIRQGDVLACLREMPSESVYCCITSPPYYGLRDYAVEGQIGLEETLEEYVRRLVEVFAEVWRVLRGDGTLWLNLGDSYSHGGNGARDPERWPKQSRNRNGHRITHAKQKTGVKPKNLLGVPWMVAFALRADGWYLRRDIIWSKPNPMPESVKDRPTSAHEYVFLLSKSRDYFYDADAIREPHSEVSTARYRYGLRSKYAKHASEINPTHGGDSAIHNCDRMADFINPAGRNKRSVWEIPTQPHAGAHFAVWPEALVLPMVLAGCPAGATVLDPFTGSGTTLKVAVERGRDAIGIELNPEYVEMAKQRLAGVTAPLFSERAA